jgi:hypothetical protein
MLNDLTEIQSTMILLKQAKPLQIFLPFMYDAKSNEPLFDKVSSGKVKLLPANSQSRNFADQNILQNSVLQSIL